MDYGRSDCDEKVSAGYASASQGGANVIGPRYPALLYTRIQSVQDTQLSAAAGIFNIALPRLYLNVAGVTKDQLMEDRKWKFDYLIDE